MIPGLGRYVVHHVRTIQRGDHPEGRLLKRGNLIDTELPGLVASFVYDMDLRLLSLTRKVEGVPIQRQVAERAVNRHYGTGHHRPKIKRVRRTDHLSAPWTPDTAPRPLLAPRIARRSA